MKVWKIGKLWALVLGQLRVLIIVFIIGGSALLATEKILFI